MQAFRRNLWIVLLAAGFALGYASRCTAQYKIKSFDPASQKECDKVVPSEDRDAEWIAMQRKYDYDCGQIDIQLQEADLIALQKEADRGDKQYAELFRELIRSFKTFHSAYMDEDLAECSGGSGCGAISSQDDAALTNRFLTMFASLQAGKMPSPSLNLTKEDAALNAAYQKVLQNIHMGGDDEATRTLEQLMRKSERNWLHYRDAFASYAAMRWPDVPRDRWLAYVEHQRIFDLQR